MYKGGKRSAGYAQKRPERSHVKSPHVAPKKVKQVVITRKPAVFYPKDVKSPQEKKIFEFFKLRPAGGTSESLVNSPFGRQLTEQHWQKTKEILKKAKPPKNKKDLEKILTKIMLLPEQKFVVLNEATARGLLTPKAFQEYLELFKLFLPQHWKAMHGNKTPADITRDCKRQMKAMGVKQ